MPKEPLRVWARALVSEPPRFSEPDKDLERAVCSSKLVAEPNEPPSDLKSEACSPKVVVRPKEALRDLNREVCSEKLEANAHELLRDLKKEVCSTRPAAEPNEPVIDLTKDVCSATLEPRVIDVDRVLKSALVSEPERLKESDRDLKSDDILAGPEIMPTELVSNLARAFVWDPATLNEPERALSRDVLSTNAEF
ncbi:hypothetical protein AUH73_05315 [archaeon 13_1_40CM_4_53_4]|nr:MAG: hypothetical protein AUH73_05315 [archaeon 13_1_40CM_4_53_4]